MTREPKKLPILVHIGLPKTGTTSLQQLLFDRHPEIYHLGQSNIWTNPCAKKMLRGLLLNEDIAFDELVTKKLSKHHRGLVISDEALTFGQYMLRGQQWPITSDHKTIAQHIEKKLNNAHVLIVLRNQADWLRSWHQQGLKHARFSEPNFGSWFEKEIIEHKIHLESLLDYAQLYQTYCNLLGKERVHLYFYEDFKNQYSKLGKAICHLIHVDPVLGEQLMGQSSYNISGDSFFGVSPVLQKYIKLNFSKQILSHIPKGLKKLIRQKLTRKRQYENFSVSDRYRILEKFYHSNRKLENNLPKANVPPEYFN